MQQIPGIDVAAMARAHQGGGGRYTADDSWQGTMLQPGFRLWRGVGGGYSPYHIGMETALGTSVGANATEFWQSAQVKISAKYGPRMTLAEYAVMVPTPAAFGLCSDNLNFGWGGAEQFFVPEQYASNLVATGNTKTLG